MKPLLKNSARLLSANVIAQVIGLIVYPILTRIYTPADFGLLNLFTSITGVLVILSLGEYHNAIVLPKEDRDARALVHWCSFLVAGWFVFLLCTIPFSSGIAGLFKTPELQQCWWLIPVFVLLAGGWNVLNYWYTRHAQFDRISRYQISQSVLSAVGKWGVGYGGWLNMGMIISTVAAYALSLICSICLGWKKSLRQLLLFDWKQSVAMAKKYANFPKFTLPRGLVNLLIGQLPVLVLTPIFGTEQVGYWGMALLLGFAPISIVTKALNQSLYQYTNEAVGNQHRIGRFFRKFSGITLAVGIPTFIALYFVLPWLTQWLLGEQWLTSAYYVRWMLPWLLCSVLTSSFCFLCDIFFQQKKGLYFELLLAALRIIGVGLGIYFSSFSLAIAGYSIGSAVAVAAQYVWLMGLVKKYDQSITSAGE